MLSGYADTIADYEITDRIKELEDMSEAAGAEDRAERITELVRLGYDRQPWQTEELDRLRRGYPAPVGGGLDDDEREELAELRVLAADCEGYPDWGYGVTLIADSYFADYAREEAISVTSGIDFDSWPARHIDWDDAAEELQQDYAAVDYQGYTFWIRA